MQRTFDLKNRVSSRVAPIEKRAELIAGVVGRVLADFELDKV